MTWNRRGWKRFIDKLIEVVLWCWTGIVDKARLKIARKKRWRGVFGWWESFNNIVEAPLISIIMPTLGRDATKAVCSVLAQTYKNWELIIVYDGCSDKYPLSLPWTATDDRIREFYISKKTHYPKDAIYQWLVGPVNALNYGLSKVRGAWIARIDDDDEWHPRHLEDAFASANMLKAEFVSHQIMIGKKKPKPYKFHGKWVGATQTWLYKSYLRCFKYSKHSWRWRPGNNDIDLPRRMARAGVDMKYVCDGYCHAYISPRPGLKHTGKKGWVEECSKKKPC